MTTERVSSDQPVMDDEISWLKERVKQLRADVRTHCSTIAAAYPATEFPSSLEDIVNQQQAHAQESLWRLGAGVTAFKVQDPDPRAVDGGSVLGIRFEIIRGGRFLQPYVVLLNRPYRTESGGPAEDTVAKTYLRVHRHTIPAGIPLGGLAARYLPPPTVMGEGGDDEPARRKPQDLSLFVKELRQRLVAYHNRLGAVADMRKAAGLGTDQQKSKRTRRKEEQGEVEEQEELAGDDREERNEDLEAAAAAPRIVSIGAADPEVKQVEIHWSNNDFCRLVMDDGGRVEKCVTYGEHGRDMPAAREFLQRITRIEELPGSIRRKRGLEAA